MRIVAELLRVGELRREIGGHGKMVDDKSLHLQSLNAVFVGESVHQVGIGIQEDGPCSSLRPVEAACVKNDS